MKKLPSAVPVSRIEAATRPRHDWTRNPPPANLTPFQEFTRNVDWEVSPLGPMDAWPDQLRQMVLLIMADPNPAVVFWGDDETIVYNEAYTPLIGQKHPGLQGQDPKIGFAEVWSRFEKIIRDGQQTGLPHIGDRQMLLLDRYGFLEETYYSWKFIPMVGEEGYVVASYATVVELTREIIGDRRLASLQNLDVQMAPAKTMDGFWRSLLRGLESNDKDIPLVMLYSVAMRDTGTYISRHAECDTCILEEHLGVPDGDVSALSEINLTTRNPGIGKLFQDCLEMVDPMLTVVERKHLPQDMFSSTGWRGFALPSEQFIPYPIRSRNGTLVGFMLMGLSPRKKFDSDYHDYVHLLTKQITTHISAILLDAEIKQSEHDAKAAALQRAELSSQLRQRTKEFEQSEDRFARFAGLANVGVATVGADGRLLYANPAWYEFNGLTPGNTNPLPMLDSVIPEDEHTIREEWARVLNKEPSQTFQIRTKIPFKKHAIEHGWMESEHRTGLCSAYPEIDEDGELMSATALVMDISELKWIEDQVRLRSRELEQSEIKYRTFADHAPIGVALINSDRLIEYINEAWLTIMDQSPDDKTARPWVKTVHPDDCHKIEEFFDDLINCKGPLTVEARLKRLWSINGQHPGNNQDNAWILASGYAELKRDGELKNVVCWITDISMQKAVAKGLNIKMNEALELKRQQENFIDMISHEIRNPLSAVLHCAEEIERSINESLTAMDLLASDASRNNSLQLKISQRLQNCLEAVETIAHCVQHQKRVVDDVLTLSKLDSELLTISPIPLSPGIIARQAFKLFEGELRIAQIKSTVIEDPSLRELEVDWVLLDPSRLLQVLINLITNAIKFTRNEEKREIMLKVAASKTKPTTHTTSVDYFPQQATGKRNSIKCKENHGEVIYLSFAVTDTGKGLSPDEKVRLFQRFVQGSPKTHVEYGGSGLGLFISRQITEMMGGEIGVASEEGCGSTFMFFVKTQIVVGSKGNHFASKEFKFKFDSAFPSSELSQVRFGSIGAADAPGIAKVLLVEDNLVNQRVLSKQLQDRGYVVVAANHGGEALEELYKTTSYIDGTGGSEGEFDLILMDIEMPHMDGLSCVRHIRNMEANGKLKGHIPVVGVTANVRIEHVKAALEAGMDGVTTKPYRMDELVGQMKTAYRNSR